MASEARFAEVQKMLAGAGYELTRIHGSHHIFTKAGRPTVSTPCTVEK